jgi:hypothetical protein
MLGRDGILLLERMCRTTLPIVQDELVRHICPPIG